jgi:acyl carrier protein
MNKDEIFSLIAQYFHEQLEIPNEKIVPQAHLFRDLGLDSIDALDMVGMLEAELNIEVNEAEIRTIRTVSDVVDFISRNMPAA